MTTSNSTIDTITISSGDSIYTGNIDLVGDIDITGSGGAIGAGGNVTLSGAGGYTISSGAGTTFTLSDVTPVNYYWEHNEWEDCFPDFDRVKAMCECYPGLQIALEKFKTVYKLVKDDYENPKD
jgi:hypothetical protein